MTWVAVAVVGSAVVGGVASNQAAKKQAKGTEKGIAATKELALQARNDAIGLFQQGQKSGIKGIQSAMDFYKNSANAIYQPYIQGNVAAQDVIGQGAMQAGNAILGLPVDMGFTQPRQITPDLSYLQGATLPAQEQMMLGGGQDTAAPQDQAAKPAGSSSSLGSILGGSGIMMNPFDKNRLDPRNRIGNPLGFSEKTEKKLEKVSPGKRLIKKIF